MWMPFIWQFCIYNYLTPMFLFVSEISSIVEVECVSCKFDFDFISIARMLNIGCAEPLVMSLVRCKCDNKYSG